MPVIRVAFSADTVPACPATVVTTSTSARAVPTTTLVSPSFVRVNWNSASVPETAEYPWCLSIKSRKRGKYSVASRSSNVSTTCLM